MTTRIPGRWVITHRQPLVLVRGWQAGEVLRRHGFKPLYSRIGKGWVLDEDRLADVAAIAALRTRGYRLIHDDGVDCGCAVAPREQRLRDVDPSVCECGDLGPLPAELLELLDLLGAEELEHTHRGAA